MCKRPNIEPKALDALEAYGAEPTKILLMNWFGYDREEVMKVDGVEVRRGEIQDWLNWKARKDARVAIITMWAAIAAAILSVPTLWAVFRGS
jgi:hypothetical protein